jgi:3-methyl-2-oxobutanoate hydroxymethyltransferase
MIDKITAPKIVAKSARQERIVCITAYDAVFGEMADAAGVDIVLVGDSMGNVFLGYETTVPVTLDQICHHVAATSRGVNRALLVGDLPFGSYQASVDQAVTSSVAIMQAGAESVKLEGEYVEQVEALVKAGIPVMGHLGMTPQSVNKFGGHKVQGKGADAQAIVESAKRLEGAGAYAIVLELIPASTAEEVTRAISIPTIGIGAGIGCSGQIQVLHDVLGLSKADFKHAKKYANGYECLQSAIRDYASEVRSGAFPAPENSF